MRPDDDFVLINEQMRERENAHRRNMEDFLEPTQNFFWNQLNVLLASRGQNSGPTSSNYQNYREVSNRNRNSDAFSPEVQRQLDDLYYQSTRKPIENGVLAQLPTSTFDGSAARSGQKDCVICCEEYKKGDQLLTLPCVHIYHKKCIATWLQQQSSCPVCKFEIKNLN